MVLDHVCELGGLLLERSNTFVLLLCKFHGLLRDLLEFRDARRVEVVNF